DGQTGPPGRPAGRGGGAQHRRRTARGACGPRLQDRTGLHRRHPRRRHAGLAPRATQRGAAAHARLPLAQTALRGALPEGVSLSASIPAGCGRMAGQRIQTPCAKMNSTNKPAASSPDLRKYAWLAIGTAVFTVLLKASAWAITGSVGLLSDAAESMVNLVAAIVALVSLTIAARPADHNHHFGHGKAEYFSAALEGIMVFVAAASIIYLGIERLFNPRPLQSLGIGLAIS